MEQLLLMHGQSRMGTNIRSHHISNICINNSYRPGCRRMQVWTESNRQWSCYRKRYSAGNSKCSSKWAPVANAGTDKTIALPTSTTSLTGTGTDADGTIASYAWTKGRAQLRWTSSVQLQQPQILQLWWTQVYLFELKVPDNSGAIGKDTVQVTVTGTTNTPTAVHRYLFREPLKWKISITVAEWHIMMLLPETRHVYRTTESVDLKMAVAGTYLYRLDGRQWVDQIHG